MRPSAVRLEIHGVVQGVGFRPFVHRLAVACNLAGSVSNRPGCVVVRVEGTADDIARFAAALRTEAPPAARILSVRRRRVAPAGAKGFSIAPSGADGVALSTIPPDIALCADCAREMADPADRRHRYPFINCTNCGPRFTIVTKLPYDRPHTSMAPFALCPACRREYEDVADRRFHAEPVACPACGPRLFLAAPGGGAVPGGGDPVGAAAEALRAGRIVALKGLGGFQLAADATNETAVSTLRERKRREEKPFAVMVSDIAAARRVARVDDTAARLLASPSAPIVLLTPAGGSPLCPSVAPGLNRVGVFLPYTPLHRLLLDAAGLPLVMTSGNVTDEPIAIGNDEALARLSGLADLFLLHDRDIVQRADDTVVRVVRGKAYPIRRARGLVPAPVVLPSRSRCVAGLGGELKSTFCFVKEDRAYLSQHIGDLDQEPVRAFYAEAFAFFGRYLDAAPEAVCHDLHPAYFTTGFARGIPARRTAALQHHKAHLYALLAESGFRGKAVGVAFDGTGYGEDGTIWGGEFFRIDGMAMERAASLDPFPLQGGDSAVRAPWKTALGLLHAAYGAADALAVARSLFRNVPESDIALVLDAIDKGINAVPTTSCGRLFDGVAALSGVCSKASYEGQAAMLLEAALPRTGRAGAPYPFRVEERDGRLGIDWRDTVRSVVDDIGRGAPAPVVAARFHGMAAAAIADVAVRLAGRSGARTVLLSGGVFQNARLLSALLRAFRGTLSVVIHREVPTNDGGISLGQAFYAAHVLSGG